MTSSTSARTWGVCALLAAICALAGSASATTPRLSVLGFQSEGSSPGLIDRNAHSMSMVGVDGIDLARAGQVTAPDAAARRQLARSHHDGLPAMVLVSNWSNRINDFYEPLAWATLGRASAVQSAASAIAHYVTSQGWDGVSVDLESLARRDAAGLTAFVTALRSDLPPAASLTICLQAATSRNEYRADGYNLAGLAAHVDQIVLMTYDDHGPWENTPGPIGPTAWQRASVRALRQVVPAREVFLGAADYGYAWRPHSNVNLTVAQVRRLVARWHARAHWVPQAGEWTAHLRDGSTLWWSDARSLRLRLSLARGMGLHGVAVWSLGTGDVIPRARG